MKKSDSGDVENGRRPSFMDPTKASQDRRESVTTSKRHGRTSVTSNDSSGSLGPLMMARQFSEDEDKTPRYKAFQTSMRMGMCTQECLKSVSLFQKCSAEFVELLAEQVTTQIFAAGQDILRQGDIGDSMYVLNRGEVEVIIGEGVVVATLTDGTVFGEMAAISKNKAAAKRSATVRAKVICDCRVIAHDSLMRTLARCRADEVIIESEAQRRLAELRAKGAIPGAQDWRVAPKRSEESTGRSSQLWRRGSTAATALSALAGLGRGKSKESDGESSPDSPRCRATSLGGERPSIDKFAAAFASKRTRADSKDSSGASSPGSRVDVEPQSAAVQHAKTEPSSKSRPHLGQGQLAPLIEMPSPRPSRTSTMDLPSLEALNIEESQVQSMPDATVHSIAPLEGSAPVDTPSFPSVVPPAVVPPLLIASNQSLPAVTLFSPSSGSSMPQPHRPRQLTEAQASSARCAESAARKVACSGSGVKLPSAVDTRRLMRPTAAARQRLRVTRRRHMDVTDPSGMVMHALRNFADVPSHGKHLQKLNS